MSNWFFFAHFVTDIYNAMLNPIMPFIAEKIGMPMGLAAMVLSFSYVVAALLQPLFGYLADRINKRFFIFWGLILAAVFVPLAVTANSVASLVCFVVFGALGISLFHPQALGCVIKKSGVFITVGSLGYALAPIISSLITKYFGLDKVVFMSVIGIITALLMFKFVPKLPVCAPSGENVFMTVIKNKTVMRLTVIAMAKGLNTSACCILLPFLWKEMGRDITYIGLALFLFFFLGGFGSMFSNKLKNFIGERNIFYFSLTSVWILMMMFVLTYNHAVLSMVIFVMVGFVTMALVPVNIVMAQKALPQYKSVTAGIINGFSFGLANILAMAAAFLAQGFGVIPVLACVAFVPLSCNLLVKYLPKE